MAQKDQSIVIHCKDTVCADRFWEAAKAADWGYRQVFFFPGGAAAWEEAGYPVQASGRLQSAGAD